jgi:predicted dehydrogenase
VYRGEDAATRLVEDPDVDAVLIATTPRTHAALLHACLKAGKPCWVEKPLVAPCRGGVRPPTQAALREAWNVHNDVLKSSVPVFVDHEWLFDPRVQAWGAHLARLAAEGDDAALVTVESSAWHPPSNPQEDVGVLWEWLPHDFSILLTTLSKPDVTHARAAWAPEVQGPEAAAVALRFSGGAEGWVTVNRAGTDKHRCLTARHTSGTTVVMDASRVGIGVAPPGGKVAWQDGEPVGDGHTALNRALSYFLQGVQGGDRSKFGTGLALDIVRLIASVEEALG